MKKILLLLVFILPLSSFAQTSWKGTVNTDWNNSGNWTSGTPSSSKDVIIGDVNFTGGFQPSLLPGSTANCKTLTIGANGINSTLTVAKNINISGNITIGSNGTVLHNTAGTVITVKGNWTNSGTYSATNATALVTFSGAAQSITGTAVFMKVAINSGSTVTLANNITINTDLLVNGTIDPTASFTVLGTGTLNLNSGGTLMVKALNFTNNYAQSGVITLNGKGTVNYASAVIDQNVSNAYTYGYLRISGGMTKYLVGNLPQLNCTSNTAGRIYLDAGTFDMQTFTADRGTPTAGGSFVIATGAKLKIGGTNSFPINYNTVTIASNSTVEYCGTNQTITAFSYGNLTFSSSSGMAIKTMPITTMTLAGSLTSYAGGGTGVSFTAGANLTIGRDVNLDASSTFNGSTFSHTFKANWINNGIFNGNTSTATYSGANAILSGTGTNNFYNLTFSAVGITALGTTSINVSGNIASSGSGKFTHNTGGLTTITGAAKVISGTKLSFYNLFITGTITTTGTFTIAGDFTVNGTFSATSGTITMAGTSKVINGSGTISFSTLNILGSISTSNDFAIISNFPVSLAGSFTSTIGTVTFNGSTVLSGTANLYNVTIASGKTLRLGTLSVLGIANIFVKTGTLNVTTSAPNIVQFNSSGAQSIVSATYSNLIMANGGTKTATGTITVNNDFTINSGVSFNASTFTFSLYRHFTNNGTFTCGTSTVSLLGANAATIKGTSTFNNIIVNKSSALVWVTFSNNEITNNLTMTSGNIKTGAYSVTITGARTGAGLIIGTITHSHAFVSGTSYYFEGLQNAITFTTPSASLNSVTITVIIGIITDFNPAQECVTREYDISIPVGTFTSATLRMHYEDNELNAFDEPNLSDYKFNSGTSVWDSIGLTTRSTVSNYVEKTGITALTGRWTFSGLRNVVRWNGSVSSVWENPSNWTTISGSNMSNRIPSSTDDAQIGQSSFTNNPVINSAQVVNILRFGSGQSSILTINSGSLNAVGGTKGEWLTAASHILDVASGTLTVGTNVDLSDGTNGHDITLRIGTGTATIQSDLNQKATGGVTFSGNGNLIISGNHNYTSGNFTAGTGTVTYSGGMSQLVAPLIYNNLSFTKSTERASINFPAVINGSLSTSIGGELAILDTITVAGNITIGTGTNFIEMGTRINIGGNWTNNGTFTVNNGTVNFNSNVNQTVNANTFNTIMVNKSAGTLTLTGDLILNSDLLISSGTVDVSTYLADRSNPGGNLTLGPSCSLKVAGAANFPNYYISVIIDNTSTVEFYGAIAQNVLDLDFGNLTFTNGTSTPKTLLGSVTVNGDLLINAGATLNPDTCNLTLYGHFTNNGTYTPATSTLILNGTSKNFVGTTTINNLNVLTGSYTITSGDLAIAGNLFVDAGGFFSFAASNSSLDGDLTNKGSLISNGIVTFTGTRVQTFQLLNAVTSTSTGVVNFNGTFAPIANSTSSPNFATVNINNTGGAITPGAPWTVFVACNIAAGAAFGGGALTHNFYGNFTNNGTVTSSGKLKFSPGAPFSASGTIKLDAAGGSFTSTGEVEFAGTAPITIQSVNPSLNTVTVSNTNAAGVSPPTSWAIAQDLNIGIGSIFNAGTALSHLISGNMTNNGTLNGGTSTVTFDGSPQYINGLGTTNFNNLTIATGANIILNESINIAGNFVDNSSFTTNARTVTFNGATPSTISGTAPFVTFDYMEQNKTVSTTTTTLLLPVFVNGGLEMTNGIVSTTAINLLTLNDDATSTSGSDTSFVDGPMRKVGNDAFVFPLGNTTIWARLGISAPASVTAAFDAQYFNAPYSNTTSITAPLNNVSTVEYWMLSRTSGSDNATVTLYWENGVRSGIGNLVDVLVAHFPVASWISETQAGGTTGTSATGTVTSQLISSFSPFTFGFPVVLPVQFISFEATSKDAVVNLDWSTASEKNNDYFTVEKSSNGIYFEEVTKVKGAGTTTQKNSYHAVDIHPFSGISYYRIKQTDINGEYIYTNIVAVNTTNGLQASIYPTMIGAGDDVNILIPELLQSDNSEILIKLYNTEGSCVMQKTVSGNQSQIVLSNIGNDLQNGLYSIVGSGTGIKFNSKVVIRK